MKQPNTIIHGGQTLFQIPAFPAYYIDRSGNFYSTYRLHDPRGPTGEASIQRKLNPGYVKGGYPGYVLYHKGRHRTVLGHRIICRVFHGPQPDGRPLVCHRNDIPDDNRTENLYWATASENICDAVRHGRIDHKGERNARAILTTWEVLAIRKRLSKGESGTQCAVDYGVSASTVSLIKLRKTWAHI